MLDPVVRTIEVPCHQTMAFEVFVEHISSWWPLGKFSVSAMGGQVARSVHIVPKEGGKIIETSPDGTEHSWGTVRLYEPSDFFSMNFHIAQPTEVVEELSIVDVRFTALGETSTRVELSQHNWEAFGKRAEMMQGGYGSGWSMIFEQAYQSACAKYAGSS